MVIQLDHDEQSARIMPSGRSSMLADPAARLLALAEGLFRPADQLDNLVRRWVIPVQFEGTPSMPYKVASSQRSRLSSSTQIAIGHGLRAEYVLERSMPARLAGLLREFEQRSHGSEAFAKGSHGRGA
jgi:hypothetical protein